MLLNEGALLTPSPCHSTVSFLFPVVVVTTMVAVTIVAGKYSEYGKSGSRKADLKGFYQPKRVRGGSGPVYKKQKNT